ncbi:hypothetical protein F0562_020554 [Nyssa sinensis]|uniref:Uncharacterized protein n=1 Tax=Nyssa sinensis TaxID=561372 RepID=A0A5J5BSK2_9ASTE|nr:hypothetical protein F0562_020554 [Nyssa sinensis]
MGFGLGVDQINNAEKYKKTALERADNVENELKMVSEKDFGESGSSLGHGVVGDYGAKESSRYDFSLVRTSVLGSEVLAA